MSLTKTEQEVSEVQMRDIDAIYHDKDVEDPDEYCVNCGAKIYSMYKKCPFCGKTWWRYERNESK